MRITQTAIDIFRAANSGARYVSACGGTRSGKTWGILQYIVLLGFFSEKYKNTLWSVVAETYPHLRRGAIRDFCALLQSENLFNAKAWNKTESTYIFPSGMRVEFFSADNAGKVHGAARDFLFVNECQNINYDIARQLFVRTRQKIILDYNPVSSFWLNEKIEPLEHCARVHSTYLQNDFLTNEQRAEIERNKADSNWWRVYGEGKIGEVEGLIYKDFTLIDSLPTELPTVCGIDFGFTHDPTAIVLVAVDKRKKEIYLRELAYQKGLLNSDIASLLPRGVDIYADCAEPKSIAELSRMGFRIYPANKAAAKKVWQIQWLQGWRLFVTKDSLNVINELRNYSWRKYQDKFINEPIDAYDHAMDAIRYAVFTAYSDVMKGQYCIH